MKYNMLEHEKMAEMKSKHPDWIWNRSDTHAILGLPGSLEAFKTPVEPGNSFSPGPGTYGVSSWIYTDGNLHTPEEKQIEELKWSFEEGYIPVLKSEWKAGELKVTSQLFTEGSVDTSDIKNYFSVVIENPGKEVQDCSFYLVIRSFGAAGGPIRQLALKKEAVYINDAPLIFPDTTPSSFGAVSYEESGTDISQFLKKGELPGLTEVNDNSTWASGAVEYKIRLNAGEKVKYDFIFHLHVGHWMLDWIKSPEKPFKVDEVRDNFIKKWRDMLPIKLNLPDKRFSEAFNCQLVHSYMATVHDAPRIASISYPLWWLRDGAYVVNALNKGGFHNFAEKACKGVASRDAFGGFGSEGDAPGEGIWIISEHYLLTRDKEFLKEMYPNIKRKADLLIKMRNTDEPVKIFNEFCIPKCMLEPNTDILCIASKDGLIMGRMDHHFPLIWINSFAYLGLSRAALCARECGLDGTIYENEATDLRLALKRKASEIFGQDDRDVNCAFWPTGWATLEDEDILSKFDEFWNNVRCPDGIHHPEQLWTYFEAGQAHNYLLTGKRENTWVSIEMFLSKHTAQGLYTYHEGEDDENSAMLWQRTRGWDDINFVTPHGWTGAELFLLLRDCLVREERETLIIGSGIPESWMRDKFEVENIPTYFGNLSFKYDPALNEIEVNIQNLSEDRIKLELPVPAKLKLLCL